MHPLLKNKLVYIALASIAIITITVYAVFNYAQANRLDQDNADRIITEKLKLSNENITIDIAHAKTPEKGLVIYISDNHSPKAMREYAEKIASLSYYVATIDSQSLLTTPNTPEKNCINIAERILTISRQLQEKYTIGNDELPILVGTDEGATLVYIALAQTDKNHFHAGISINFTPHIANTHLCSLHNFTTPNSENTNRSLVNITPAKHMPTSWYIFQDKLTAENKNTRDFIAQINNAKLTISENAAPASDTAPISAALQILQWLDPRLADQISSSNSDSDLPLIETEATTNTDKQAATAHQNILTNKNTMAVLLTGDGGWAEIDKNVAKILAENGIPTIALDSLSYFWRERTLEETAKDIDDVINQYREKWQKDKVILIGYSFGADVLPFVANRLSEQHKRNIALIALLAMGKTAAFEFHLSSWMNADTSANRLPITPELSNMRWANSICIYGVEDEETGCTQTTSLGVKVISMSGDHHFDENYNFLVQHIIENIKQ